MNRSVAAILLAAGRSRRMGRCKQLLPLGDTTVMGRCLDTLLRGGIDAIAVVVSATGHDVADAALAYPVRVVINPDSAGDMASSVRIGRDALETSYSGVIIALCDYPLITPATITTLAHQHATSPGSIIMPTYRESRGHPLLIPRKILEELAADMTLRDLLRINPARISTVAVNDPGILMDMDTPEDFARVCSNFLSQSQ